ncbi:protein aurora borealis isoform X1 [Sphaerodactylus townsendi]|uniref:protein aurora borealis isoform X1 n=2 Tax=Sphaerodactylus townsendi TaxID=933632 RepID=UPI00202761E2|nr:protein aurora borealis isoform X1 [Sphaerodactylus townsendi]
MVQLAIMSSAEEMKTQITPETPGRLSLQNPFESPSDYSHLQEPTLSSPSFLKSSQFSLTPGQFGWSIEELASTNPVEIDSEDVRRQALYLSHSRIDKEAEEKRQKAIEEFFTKSLIVPSPWTDHNRKQDFPFNSTRCVELSSASPVSREIGGHLGKTNASCQTVLSLPIDFDLEALLGAYFKPDELADQSQESLSASSLRRKLFLDENGSLSENSLPSPQSSHDVPASLGELCSTYISPVRCRSPLNRSSSGQFSSSPVKDDTRPQSLGSLTTPPFFERSPANISSAVSPIGVQIRKTPLSGRFTFRSPDIPSSSNPRRPTPPTRSPFMECSPLKNCSPLRRVACRGVTAYQTSFVHLPSTPESFDEEQEEETKASSADISLPKVSLHQLKGRNFAHGQRLMAAGVSLSPDHPGIDAEGLTLFHSPNSLNDNHMPDMADAEEMVDVNSVKGSAENSNLPVAGLNIEGSCMCLSPLAESSATPCEGSSIQVDSGYNTQTCTSSLLDAVEVCGRETDSHVCETQNKYSLFRAKQGKPIPGYWTESEPVNQPSCCLMENPWSK